MKILLTLAQKSLNIVRTGAKNTYSVSHVFTPKKASTIGDIFVPAVQGVKQSASKIATPLKSGEAFDMPIKYKDKLTGQLSEVIAKFSSAKSGERVSIQIPGKTGLVYADIKPDYLNCLFSTEYGIGKDLIDRGGNCIWIEYMRSDIAGGGTLLHKAIAKRSMDLGYNGRVALDAAWCSHPFHYKCGFRPLCADPKIYRYNEEILNHIIAEAEKTGQRITDKDFGIMSLFLSEQKAQELIRS